MSDPRALAAVGFSIHTGWAAAVVVAGPPPRVLARRKIELADDEHDARFVYHVAAEKPDHAERTIGNTELTARDRAVAFLRQLMQDLPEYALIAGLPRSKRALPPLTTILQSHPMIHTAEGELFRRSIADAAKRLGMRVESPTPGKVPNVGKMGPPWGKDQKDAAALAWAALAEGLEGVRKPRA